eukprot:m.576811 g.576811  ORF g.576811 m.576811 type:complete len:563 (-) comp22288_c0_seq1:396-2084(-)
MSSPARDTQDAVAVASDPDRSNLRTVQLVRGPKGLGLRVIGVSHAKLEGPRGHFVSFITPNTPASAAKIFRVGDEILSVNGTAVSTMLHKEALSVLTTASSPVTISVAQNDAGWKKFCMDDGLSPESLEDRQQTAMQIQTKRHMGVTISKSPGLSPPRAHESIVHSHTLSLSQEEGVDMLCKGVAALEDERFVDAEKYLLKALHSVMDQDTAEQIIAASRQPNPTEAQRQCNRIIDAHQKSKAGVHYLIGLAITFQGDVKRAQIPFTTAVKQCMQWHYTEGMVVDPSDPSFHYAVGTSLVAGNKHPEARMALKQACRLNPKPAWIKQLNALNSELGFALQDSGGKDVTGATGNARGKTPTGDSVRTAQPDSSEDTSTASQPEVDPSKTTPRRTTPSVLKGGVKSPPYAAYDMVHAYTKAGSNGLGSKKGTGEPSSEAASPRPTTASPKTVLQPPATLRHDIPAASGSDTVSDGGGNEGAVPLVADEEEADAHRRMEAMAQQQLASDMAAMQIDEPTAETTAVESSTENATGGSETVSGAESTEAGAGGDNNGAEDEEELMHF